MFISQLKNKLVEYDIYGEHRTNGLKALFVLELMFVVNFIYTVPNPYFNYFYVPLTCFAAEIAGNTLKEKFLFLFFTIMGSVLSIFLFGILSVYKWFFVFFVFCYSMALYHFVIHYLKNMLMLVPFILGLAAYSLIYRNTSHNFYIDINHALQTILAMLIILGGLYVFPKKYYLAIWRRAFCEVIVKLKVLTAQICHEDVKTVPIFTGIIVMERYSKMLSKQMKCYTIMKITLLTFELVMAMSYFVSFQKQLRRQSLVALNHYLGVFSAACHARQPVVISSKELPEFDETHELRVLHRLMLSWNYLCTNQ